MTAPPCPQCQADDLWPVQCSMAPAVYCRGCKWQGMLSRQEATAVEMRRMREATAKREAEKGADKAPKRTLIGSIFKY